MRFVALIAFLSLQLSVFTCGFDIHVHVVDSNIGHIAQHVHDKDNNHKQTADHGCYVHTSHTFVEVSVIPLSVTTALAFEQQHQLTALQLKHIPFSIEHPPKKA